jgi:hypothetical protein
MIKSLSPYYVTTPFVSPLTSVTCTSYKLQIYVWSGDKASVPAAATYEETVLNTNTSIGDSKLNISRLVNDLITFTATDSASTTALDGNNQMWVEHDVIYTTTDPTDDDVKQRTTTALMFSGYNYGLEGENAQPPTNKVFMSGTEFNVNRSGFFNVPVLLTEDTGSQTATVISYPDNEINSTLTLPNTNDSAELVQYLWIDCSETTTDTYIQVVYNSVTITLYITAECRYTPIDIAFQNKEGALQLFTFFKVKKDTIDVTSEVFESDRGQPSETKHQFINYNVQAKIKFTVNTGFVSESINETIQQLLLSERVWQYDGADFIPLNVSTKSQEFKTRQNDRLINYQIGFDYGYNKINNI